MRDEDFDEYHVGVPLSRELSYREFRAEIIERCRDDWRRRLGADDEVSRFALLRGQVRAFRQHLVFRAAGWLESGRYPSSHIHRALGLDPAFTLELSRRERWLRTLMWLVLPTHTLMRRAVPWLRRARTFEGRAVIFSAQLPERWTRIRIGHYDRALDYGLMRWGKFPSEKIMAGFCHTHPDWIRAARHLGLDDPQSMLAWIPKRPHADNAPLFWILVRQGAITGLAEREWVDLSRRRDSFSRWDERRIGHIIRVLRQYGVERQRVVEALWTLPHHYLKPEILAQTLALLEHRGIREHGLLLQGLGVSLSSVAAERWITLLDQLGVRDAAAIIQFKPLLESHKPVAVEFGLALTALGAGAAELALCQQLMLDVGAAHDPQAPVTALALLASPPHSLGFAEIAQASAYIGKSTYLAAFLRVLDQHGFGGADGVLRFQPCYTTVAPARLARLLALTKALATPAAIEDVLEWVKRAGDAQYIDAYEYLAGALKLRTVRQLLQVARVGFLSVELLRYLVEERGLRTRQKLTDWFFDAFDIKSVRWWGASLDPVTRLLFEEAFTRQSFNFWESNRQCIDDVVRARVTGLLGRRPFMGTEEELRDYATAEQAATEAARATLLQALPAMLRKTSGILLPSITATVWDGADASSRQLAQLAPLLDELVMGRGPVTPTLTQLETEAVALIYRTAPATVQSRWQDLIGHQADIAGWGTEDSYAMTWCRAARTLRGELDRAGLEAVVEAAQWAARFRERCQTDMALACDGLQAAPADDTPDLRDLVPRLGVLFAVAANDPAAAAWLKTVSLLPSVRDESGYEQILRMQTFFGVGLSDALDARGTAFCGSLSTPSALMLAGRLGAHSDIDPDPSAALYRRLEQTAQSVGGRFLEWSGRELAKFGNDKNDGGSTTVIAMVTKHPAAFFAKEAAKLCTADNVQMWKEARHAHLAVFDPPHRSFQGMALLYREILPQIHTSRPVLVIRAINPTSDAMATYDVSSIVDAFFAAATCIARDSGCAALAFPPNTSQHLLSNLDPVDQNIQTRYLAQSGKHHGRLVLDEEEKWLRPAQEVQASFDAYERGEHRIGSLYLLWQARA